MSKMSYKALSQEHWQFGGFWFRPLRFRDIERIRLWRNSQRKYLRQRGFISRVRQISYFLFSFRKDLPLEHPEKVLLGMESGGQLVGYCGLVHINWIRDEAEVSFLVSRAKNVEEAYGQVMTAALMCLCEVAKSLGLKWLKTETYVFPERQNHLAILEAFGFSETTPRSIDVNGIESVHHRFQLGDDR
jgi:RimJ/RimL family protein N-acetyltransferase